MLSLVALVSLAAYGALGEAVTRDVDCAASSLGGAGAPCAIAPVAPVAPVAAGSAPSAGALRAALDAERPARRTVRGAEPSVDRRTPDGAADGARATLSDAERTGATSGVATGHAAGEDRSVIALEPRDLERQAFASAFRAALGRELASRAAREEHGDDRSWWQASGSWLWNAARRTSLLSVPPLAVTSGEGRSLLLGFAKGFGEAGWSLGKMVFGFGKGLLAHQWNLVTDPEATIEHDLDLIGDAWDARGELPSAIGRIARSIWGAIEDGAHTYAFGDPEDAGRVAGGLGFDTALTFGTGGAATALRGGVTAGGRAASALAEESAATAARAGEREVAAEAEKRLGGMCFVVGTPVHVAGGTAPIESLRLGDRVTTASDGVAAREADRATAVDRATWRRVEIEMADPSDPRSTLEIALLRSRDWIAAVRALPGRTIALALPEMGLRGAARVTAIGDAPEIEAGPGRVVLATVASTSEDVVELAFVGQRERLAPTGRHRLFSISRDAWTPATSLVPGEKLRALGRTATIASVTPLAGSRSVYNIEVETDHSYLVGKLGVLSHNDNPCGMPIEDPEAALMEELRTIVDDAERWDPELDAFAELDAIDDTSAIVRDVLERDPELRAWAEDLERKDADARTAAQAAKEQGELAITPTPVGPVTFDQLDELAEQAVSASPALWRPLEVMYENGWTIELGEGSTIDMAAKRFVLASDLRGTQLAGALAHGVGMIDRGAVSWPSASELTLPQYVQAFRSASIDQHARGILVRRLVLWELESEGFETAGVSRYFGSEGAARLDEIVQRRIAEDATFDYARAEAEVTKLLHELPGDDPYIAEIEESASEIWHAAH